MAINDVGKKLGDYQSYFRVQHPFTLLPHQLTSGG
jgi:hypothetical protein